MRVSPFLWYNLMSPGAEMTKHLEEFIAKLENLVRRLAYCHKDGFVDALHLIEVYCEISDLMIAFEIEMYEEDSSEEEGDQT